MFAECGCDRFHANIGGCHSLNVDVLDSTRMMVVVVILSCAECGCARFHAGDGGCTSEVHEPGEPMEFVG